MSSIEKFTQLIVKYFVIRECESFICDLNNLIKETNLRSCELNQAESIIYHLFPIHIMVGLGHFEDDGILLGEKLISNVACYISRDINSNYTDELIKTRLREYASSLFNNELLNKGRLSIKHNGLFKLGQRAVLNILEEETQNIAIIDWTGRQFSILFSSWEGGIGLKQQYDCFLELGEEKWVTAILDGLSEL